MAGDLALGASGGAYLPSLHPSAPAAPCSTRCVTQGAGGEEEPQWDWAGA